MKTILNFVILRDLSVHFIAFRFQAAEKSDFFLYDLSENKVYKSFWLFLPRQDTNTQRHIQKERIQ